MTTIKRNAQGIRAAKYNVELVSVVVVRIIKENAYETPGGLEQRPDQTPSS